MSYWRLVGQIAGNVRATGSTYRQKRGAANWIARNEETAGSATEKAALSADAQVNSLLSARRAAITSLGKFRSVSRKVVSLERETGAKVLERDRLRKQVQQAIDNGRPASFPMTTKGAAKSLATGGRRLELARAVAVTQQVFDFERKRLDQVLFPHGSFSKLKRYVRRAVGGQYFSNAEQDQILPVLKIAGRLAGMVTKELNHKSR